MTWRRSATVLAAALSLVVAAPLPAQCFGVLPFVDGFEVAGTSFWSNTTPPADAFRIDTLTLRDPHAFTLVLSIFCTDITNNLNTSIADSLDLDDDGDGLLDLSYVLAPRPLDQSGSEARFDVIPADCLAPVGSTSCVTGVDACVAATSYLAADTGTCLIPLAGTTGGYSPAPNEPIAPCFATEPTDLVVVLAGIAIPLHDVRIAAEFPADPATELTTGTLQGFLREADADGVTIAESIPLVGGMPLSSIFPGGSGNCDGGDDRDLHDATNGWWVYLDFTAVAVPFNE